MSKENYISEDVSRTVGRDAQRENILAAKMVAQIVKTTLGPKGMDKMLVNPLGDLVITNDGATILKEMQIEHPAAKMMVEIAKTQESEAGDGTTSAVMIAGKLLENAEKLLEQKIHPTTIVKGYNLALKKAQEILKEIAIKITPDNKEILKQIAITAMTGKGAEDSKEILAEVLVGALDAISQNNVADLEDIKIQKNLGEGEKAVLVSGIVLDKERLNKEMPRVVNNAKILLIDFPLELKSPEIDTKISISSHLQLQNFLDEEEISIKNMIEKIIESEANVLFCQKGIDDFAQYLLAKNGIYACRRISKSDMLKLSKAAGSKIVSNLNEINSDILGKANEVKEIITSGEKMTYVQGCINPHAVTILIRGGSLRVIAEIERAIMDALGDLISTLKTGLIVSGGGASEIELSLKLKEYSKEVGGREGMAILEFANSLEFILITLAENAGLDPIDVLTEVKRKHNQGEKHIGLNLFNDKIENVFNARILDPYKVKSQALSSANDVATMILRIDDIIAAKTNKTTEDISNYLKSLD